MSKQKEYVKFDRVWDFEEAKELITSPELKKQMDKDLPKRRVKKTGTWAVMSNRKLPATIPTSTQEYLGEIKWYAPWRQYCFYPAEETVWSRGCMIQVLFFIQKITDEKKERGKCMVCGLPAKLCVPREFCFSCKDTPRAEAIRQEHKKQFEKTRKK